MLIWYPSSFSTPVSVGVYEANIFGHMQFLREIRRVSRSEGQILKPEGPTAGVGPASPFPPAMDLGSAVSQVLTVSVYSLFQSLIVALTLDFSEELSLLKKKTNGIQTGPP